MNPVCQHESKPGRQMCLADDMEVGELTPVEETALPTLYARALDARSPHPILGDDVAVEVVAKIDYDFERLGVMPSVVCLVSLRAKMLDDRVRAFVAEHPDGQVVDLGAGLDSAVFRVDPPPSVDWYSVDMPAMIRLRDAALPQRDHAHSFAASVAETDWATRIPSDRPTMIVADGVFPFLSESVFITVLRQITDHFGSGEMAFNDYGTVSRLNRFARRVFSRKQMFRTMYKEWAFPGFRNARAPETWNPSLRLVEEVTVFREPEVSLFPTLMRLGSRIGARVPAVADKARILRYRF
jgi:O-methyltransferase involved in polyketide biosynthesis